MDEQNTLPRELSQRANVGKAIDVIDRFVRKGARPRPTAA